MVDHAGDMDLTNINTDGVIPVDCFPSGRDGQ